MNDSIQAFLSALHGAMADGEQFRLDITRNGDSLDIITLPLLGDDEDKVPEEAKPIRSALSMPLAMRNMTMAQLSDEFGQRLSGYGQARQQTNDAYQELLTSLKDAAASAKNAKTATSKKADKTSKDKPADTHKPETAPQEAEQPVSQGDKETQTDNQKPAESGGLFNY